MTEAAALPRIDPPRFGLRAAGLWAGAATLVLVAHVAVAYAVQNFSLSEMSDGGPPPALAIEMSPMVIAPAVQEETPMSDVVTPDQAEPVKETIAEVNPVTEPVEEPVVEEAEPVAEQPVEAEEATAPEPAEPTVAALSEQPPPLEEVVPDIVETVAPDVVIPLPQPKPIQTEVKANKPVEAKKTTEKKPVEKPKQRKKKEKAAPPKTVTTASIDAKAAAKTAAPKLAASASRSGDSKKWQSQLTAWVNRHKRYPSAAKARRAEGTVNVAFNVDVSGRVISVRITGSSGDSDIDRSVLDMLSGAKLPAPPEGANRLVRLPLAFSLRN